MLHHYQPRSNSTTSGLNSFTLTASNCTHAGMSGAVHATTGTNLIALPRHHLITAAAYSPHSHCIRLHQILADHQPIAPCSTASVHAPPSPQVRPPQQFQIHMAVTPRMLAAPLFHRSPRHPPPALSTPVSMQNTRSHTRTHTAGSLPCDLVHPANGVRNP